MRTCDYCGGEVSDTAKKCKHCGEWLNRDTKQQETVQKEVNNFQNSKEENFNNSTDIQTNSQSNTKTQDSYLLIILIGIVVLMIAIIAIFLFQDKINNLKGNEIEKIIKNANGSQGWHEDTIINPNDCIEGCSSEHYVDYEDVYKEQGINSTLYKVMNDDYNQIVSFKNENTGADTYAFRYKTNLELGNGGGQYFVYELGRIMINPNNPNKSKCSYNFMANYDNNPVKWSNCSETTFINSLHKIAKLKRAEYEKFKEINKLVVQSEICAYADSRDDIECQNPDLDTAYEKEKEQLAKLRSTTL